MEGLRLAAEAIDSGKSIVIAASITADGLIRLSWANDGFPLAELDTLLDAIREDFQRESERSHGQHLGRSSFDG